MKELEAGKFKLIVTSPPYNLGKEYESKTNLQTYLDLQREVVQECVRLLHPEGSICWQVGNYVENGAIVPLDAVLYPVFTSLALKLRNRIIWHFGHGLHCSKRLSGRYETINWWTRGEDYTWNLDPIRVPQKYPGKKHYKGEKAGRFPATPKARTRGMCGSFPMSKAITSRKRFTPASTRWSWSSVWCFP